MATKQRSSLFLDAGDLPVDDPLDVSESLPLDSPPPGGALEPKPSFRDGGSRACTSSGSFGATDKASPVPARLGEAPNHRPLTPKGSQRDLSKDIALAESAQVTKPLFDNPDAVSQGRGDLPGGPEIVVVDDPEGNSSALDTPERGARDGTPRSAGRGAPLDLSDSGLPGEYSDDGRTGSERAHAAAHKAVLVREGLLGRLKACVRDASAASGGSKKKQQAGDPTASEHASAAAAVLRHLRAATATVVESIVAWQQLVSAELSGDTSGGGSTVPPKPPRFLWQGRVDYAGKMLHDLDFLAECRPLCEALGIEPEALRNNPLALPPDAEPAASAREEDDAEADKWGAPLKRLAEAQKFVHEQTAGRPQASWFAHANASSMPALPKRGRVGARSSHASSTLSRRSRKSRSSVGTNSTRRRRVRPYRGHLKHTPKVDDRMPLIPGYKSDRDLGQEIAGELHAWMVKAVKQEERELLVTALLSDDRPTTRVMLRHGFVKKDPVADKTRHTEKVDVLPTEQQIAEAYALPKRTGGRRSPAKDGTNSRRGTWRGGAAIRADAANELETRDKLLQKHQRATATAAHARQLREAGTKGVTTDSKWAEGDGMDIKSIRVANEVRSAAAYGFSADEAADLYASRRTVPEDFVPRAAMVEQNNKAEKPQKKRKTKRRKDGDRDAAKAARRRRRRARARRSSEQPAETPEAASEQHQPQQSGDDPQSEALPPAEPVPKHRRKFKPPGSSGSAAAARQAAAQESALAEDEVGAGTVPAALRPHHLQPIEQRSLSSRHLDPTLDPSDPYHAVMPSMELSRSRAERRSQRRVRRMHRRVEKWLGKPIGRSSSPGSKRSYNQGRADALSERMLDDVGGSQTTLDEASEEIRRAREDERAAAKALAELEERAREEERRARGEEGGEPGDASGVEADLYAGVERDAKDSIAQSEASRYRIDEPVIRCLGVSCLELEQMAEPLTVPKPLALLCSAVLMLLSPGKHVPKDMSWPATRSQLTSTSTMLARVCTFDRSAVPQWKVRALKPIITDELLPADALRENPIAVRLCDWLYKLFKSSKTYSSAVGSAGVAVVRRVAKAVKPRDVETVCRAAALGRHRIALKSSLEAARGAAARAKHRFREEKERQRVAQLLGEESDTETDSDGSYEMSLGALVKKQRPATVGSPGLAPRSSDERSRRGSVNDAKKRRAGGRRQSVAAGQAAVVRKKALIGGRNWKVIVFVTRVRRDEGASDAASDSEAGSPPKGSTVPAIRVVLNEILPKSKPARPRGKSKPASKEERSPSPASPAPQPAELSVTIKTHRLRAILGTQTVDGVEEPWALATLDDRQLSRVCAALIDRVQVVQHAEAPKEHAEVGDADANGDCLAITADADVLDGAATFVQAQARRRQGAARVERIRAEKAAAVAQRRNEAATKIQSHGRKALARKKVGKRREEAKAAEEARQASAATKIQARQRGRVTRAKAEAARPAVVARRCLRFGGLGYTVSVTRAKPEDGGSAGDYTVRVTSATGGGDPVKIAVPSAEMGVVKGAAMVASKEKALASAVAERVDVVLTVVDAPPGAGATRVLTPGRVRLMSAEESQGDSVKVNGVKLYAAGAVAVEASYDASKAEATFVVSGSKKRTVLPLADYATGTTSTYLRQRLASIARSGLRSVGGDGLRATPV